MADIEYSEEEIVNAAERFKSQSSLIDDYIQKLGRVLEEYEDAIIEPEYTRDLHNKQNEITDAAADQLKEVMYELAHTRDRIDHLTRAIVHFAADQKGMLEGAYSHLKLANADIAFNPSKIEPKDSDDADRYAPGNEDAEGNRYDADRVSEDVEGYKSATPSRKVDDGPYYDEKSSQPVNNSDPDRDADSSQPAKGSGPNHPVSSPTPAIDSEIIPENSENLAYKFYTDPEEAAASGSTPRPTP